MIVQDNTEIQGQVKKLTGTLEKAIETIRHLDKLADARYEEVDILDEAANFDKLIFDMRAIMFNSKIELEKIQKAVHKHVAHTLNPIAKTAPKKEKSKSARKERDAGKPDTSYTNDLYRAIETITNYDKMNEIMPGKDGHHSAKKPKHTTISRGNAPQSNPAHDSDKPF